MKDYTFNFEVVTLTTQFADAFNDIVVKRYNGDREANGQEIGVTFIYAPKQRVIYDLTNKQNELRLPIVSFNINSFARDESRVFNKLQGADIVGSLKYDHIRQPVPVNLGISLNVMTKFQLDMDQIISNFTPYCDPYVVVSWPDPFAGQEIRTIIEWDGSVSITYPMDQGATIPFSRIEAAANFTVKGWLFKKQDGNYGRIHNIYSNFFAVRDIFCNYTSMQQATSEDATDYMVVSGRPVINHVNPYVFQSANTGYDVTVYGDMFEKTTDYYLSGAVSGIGPITVYDYTTAQYMSAYIDYISGIKITPTILSNNALTFTLDITGASAGYIDIIGINDAGIGRLTVDSVRDFPCPYPLSADCVDWTPSQPDYINGILVF